MHEKPLTIGMVLRRIRERLNMNFVDMGAHCKVEPSSIASMEADKKRVLRKHREAYERLPLTEQERETLAKLYHEWDKDKSLITCDDCSAHDGEMRPGGQLGQKIDDEWDLGDRDELCTNAGNCLAVFVKRYGCTKTAHCPRNCTRREYVERERIVSIGSLLAR